MKEKLINFVMEEANKCYSDDFPIQNIEKWIREFFIKYQPERLNPEDTCCKVYYRSDHGVYEKLEKCVCDSPISEDK